LHGCQPRFERLPPPDCGIQNAAAPSFLKQRNHNPSKEQLLRNINSLAQENMAALKKAGLTEKDVVEKSLRAR